MCVCVSNYFLRFRFQGSCFSAICLDAQLINYSEAGTENILAWPCLIGVTFADPYVLASGRFLVIAVWEALKTSCRIIIMELFLV